jgi:gp16 family phage-associated protein
MRISPQKLLQVKNQFFQDGRSVADWARTHQFSEHLVYAVLSGRSKASRGESHRIATELGLKSPGCSTPPNKQKEKT